MKIFIGWSGDFSGEVAALLKDCLDPQRSVPRLPGAPILPGVRAFISTQGIPSGAQYAEVLARELKKTEFAIVCLTPQNLESPWLFFEAGTLTSQSTRRLCALLLGGVTPADVRGPLERYQHRVMAQDPFRLLLDDIRKVLTPRPTAKEFDDAFAQLWPNLWAEYQKIEKKYPSIRPRKMDTASERIVLKLPLAEQSVSEMSAIVESIRRKCLQHLRALPARPDVPSECLRANVFVPAYTGLKSGYAVELVMPERLRREMNRPEEWHVRFAPGQGSTGNAFVECHQRITDRRNFELSDEQRNAIDPDLKWIISTPICGSSDYALAVLNIDGLKCEFDKEKVLHPLGEVIEQEIRQLDSIVDAAPKTLVTVQYGDLDG